MDDDYYDCYDDEFDAALTEFESDDKDTQPVNNAADDPEHFHYNAVSEAQVLAIINPAVDDLSERIGVSKDLAKNLLIQHKWDSTGILSRFDFVTNQPINQSTVVVVYFFVGSIDWLIDWLN